MTTPPPPQTAAILTAAEMQAIRERADAATAGTRQAHLFLNSAQADVLALLATAEHYAGVAATQQQRGDRLSEALDWYGYATSGDLFNDRGQLARKALAGLSSAHTPPPAETRTEAADDYDRAISMLDRPGEVVLTKAQGAGVLRAVRAKVAAERARADAAEADYEALTRRYKELMADLLDVKAKWDFQLNRADAAEKDRDQLQRELSASQERVERAVHIQKDLRRFALKYREFLAAERVRADAAENARSDAVSDVSSLVVALDAERETVRRLREVLAEVADWLCAHPGAKELLEANPGTRFWCCECHEYVRSQEQATLKERVTALLAALASPPAARAPQCEHDFEDILTPGLVANHPEYVGKSIRCKRCGETRPLSWIRMSEAPPDLTLEVLDPPEPIRAPAAGETPARKALRIEGMQSSIDEIRRAYEAGERRGGVRYRLILDLAELAFPSAVAPAANAGGPTPLPPRGVPTGGWKNYPDCHSGMSFHCRRPDCNHCRPHTTVDQEEMRKYVAALRGGAPAAVAPAAEPQAFEGDSHKLQCAWHRGRACDCGHAPAAEPAPAGTLAENYQREIHALRLLLLQAQDYQKGDVWYWQGDKEDHLESLVCPVVIRAEVLRELLAVAAPAAEPEPEPATDDERDATRYRLLRMYVLGGWWDSQRFRKSPGVVCFSSHGEDEVDRQNTLGTLDRMLDKALGFISRAELVKHPANAHFRADYDEWRRQEAAEVLAQSGASLPLARPANPTTEVAYTPVPAETPEPAVHAADAGGPGPTPKHPNEPTFGEASDILTRSRKQGYFYGEVAAFIVGFRYAAAALAQQPAGGPNLAEKIRNITVVPSMTFDNDYEKRIWKCGGFDALKAAAAHLAQQHAGAATPRLRNMVEAAIETLGAASLCAAEHGGPEHPDCVPASTIDDVVRDLRAALASSPAAREAKHDPSSGPCPTCGFQVTRSVSPGFEIPDDDATAPEAR